MLLSCKIILKQILGEDLNHFTQYMFLKVNFCENIDENYSFLNVMNLTCI